MFAVVRTGGKQYRVAPGDKIVVEKLDGNAGDRIELGDVLLAGNAGKLESTDGLKVAAEIVAQAKADKVTVFKKRRRHNYRRKKGHRQQHTILRIVAIGDHKHVPSKAEGEEKKAAPVDKPAKAPAPAPAKSNPAKVEEIPTENPAPDNQEQANPPVKTAAKTAAKAKPVAETKAKPAAKAKVPSTKNAAPAKPAPSKAAKPAAKKTPKAK